MGKYDALLDGLSDEELLSVAEQLPGIGEEIKLSRQRSPMAWMTHGEFGKISQAVPHEAGILPEPGKIAEYSEDVGGAIGRVAGHVVAPVGGPVVPALGEKAGQILGRTAAMLPELGVLGGTMGQAVTSDPIGSARRVVSANLDPGGVLRGAYHTLTPTEEVPASDAEQFGEMAAGLVAPLIGGAISTVAPMAGLAVGMSADIGDAIAVLKQAGEIGVEAIGAIGRGDVQGVADAISKLDARQASYVTSALGVTAGLGKVGDADFTHGAKPKATPGQRHPKPIYGEPTPGARPDVRTGVEAGKAAEYQRRLAQQEAEQAGIRPKQTIKRVSEPIGREQPEWEVGRIPERTEAVVEGKFVEGDRTQLIPHPEEFRGYTPGESFVTRPGEIDPGVLTPPPKTDPTLRKLEVSAGKPEVSPALTPAKPPGEAVLSAAEEMFAGKAQVEVPGTGRKFVGKFEDLSLRDDGTVVHTSGKTGKVQPVSAKLAEEFKSRAREAGKVFSDDEMGEFIRGQEAEAAALRAETGSGVEGSASYSDPKTGAAFMMAFDRMAELDDGKVIYRTKGATPKTIKVPEHIASEFRSKLAGKKPVLAPETILDGHVEPAITPAGSPKAEVQQAKLAKRSLDRLSAEDAEIHAATPAEIAQAASRLSGTVSVPDPKLSTGKRVLAWRKMEIDKETGIVTHRSKRGNVRVVDDLETALGFKRKIGCELGKKKKPPVPIVSEEVKVKARAEAGPRGLDPKDPAHPGAINKLAATGSTFDEPAHLADVKIKGSELHKKNSKAPDRKMGLVSALFEPFYMAIAHTAPRIVFEYFANLEDTYYLGRNAAARSINKLHSILRGQSDEFVGSHLRECLEGTRDTSLCTKGELASVTSIRALLAEYAELAKKKDPNFTPLENYFPRRMQPLSWGQPDLGWDFHKLRTDNPHLKHRSGMLADYDTNALRVLSGYIHNAHNKGPGGLYEAMSGLERVAGEYRDSAMQRGVAGLVAELTGESSRFAAADVSARNLGLNLERAFGEPARADKIKGLSDSLESSLVKLQEASGKTDDLAITDLFQKYNKARSELQAELNNSWAAVPFEIMGNNPWGKITHTMMSNSAMAVMMMNSKHGLDQLVQSMETLLHSRVTPPPLEVARLATVEGLQKAYDTTVREVFGAPGMDDATSAILRPSGEYVEFWGEIKDRLDMQVHSAISRGQKLQSGTATTKLGQLAAGLGQVGRLAGDAGMLWLTTGDIMVRVNAAYTAKALFDRAIGAGGSSADKVKRLMKLDGGMKNVEARITEMLDAGKVDAARQEYAIRYVIPATADKYGPSAMPAAILGASGPLGTLAKAPYQFSTFSRTRASRVARKLIQGDLTPLASQVLSSYLMATAVHGMMDTVPETIDHDNPHARRAYARFAGKPAKRVARTAHERYGPANMKPVPSDLFMDNIRILLGEGPPGESGASKLKRMVRTGAMMTTPAASMLLHTADAWEEVVYGKPLRAKRQKRKMDKI